MVCQVCSGSQSIMSICGVILNGIVLDAIITITITIMIMNLKHHSVYSAKIQDVGVGQHSNLTVIGPLLTVILYVNSYKLRYANFS